MRNHSPGRLCRHLGKPGILRPDDQRARVRMPAGGITFTATAANVRIERITIVPQQIPEGAIPCDQRPTIPRHLRYWSSFQWLGTIEKVGSYGELLTVP